MSALHSMLGCLAALALSGVAHAANITDKPPLPAGAHRPLLSFHLRNGSAGPGWKALEGKVVVMDFWATWCGPCIASFPKINALEAKFKGAPVRFYSVSYETEPMIAPLLAKHPLTTTIGLDNDFKTYEAFNAWGIPVVYVFDRKGVLLTSVHPDNLDAQVIEDALAGRPLKVKPAQAWADPSGAEAYFRSLRDKGAGH